MRRLALTLLLAIPATLHAEDWPQFRGPDGQGHSSETGLPAVWNENQNIAWHTPIPGLGWSSPVVKGDTIWLTTAIEEQNSLHALALDRRTGRVLWNTEVFRKTDLGRINAKNSHASATPVVDGDSLYVHFGSHGTACLTTAGQIVWQTQLPHDHHHGPGSSPIIWRDFLFVNCDGVDVQYVVALDKHTGRTIWRADRPGKNAYSTPLLVFTGREEQLISSGGDGVFAYRPQTGEELWHCRYEGHSVIPRPVFGAGLVHVCSGYWTPTLYSIRVDGRGDVTTTHIAHAFHRGVPFTPSPLLVGDRLLLASDRGVATCLDARTGRLHWTKRLPGTYSASPIAADGKIYCLNEEGTTTVLAIDAEFRELAVNALPGRTLASLAVSGKSIFLRTDLELYCIQNTSREPHGDVVPASVDDVRRTVSQKPRNQ